MYIYCHNLPFELPPCNRKPFVVNIKQIFLGTETCIFDKLNDVYIFEIIIKLFAIRVWYFINQTQKICVFKFPRLGSEIRQSHGDYINFLLYR